MVELLWDNKKEMLEEVNSDDFLKTDKHFEYNREESKNFDTTENLYIEGDNLEALKLLQKDYKNKVKMIYIDPTYNTESIFIYNARFRNKRKKECRHSGWLNMMYPRLKLAKDLLRDDGVIFISIDDNEVDNLKKLADEIFGNENIISILPTIMNLKGNNDQFGFAGTHEYTLVCCKSKNNCEFGYLPVENEKLNEWEYDDYGAFKKGANLKSTGVNAPREKRPNLYFPLYISIDNKVNLERKSEKDVEVLPITDGKEMSWRWSKNKFINEPHNIIISRNNDNISIYKKTRPLNGKTPSQKPKTLFYKPEYSSGNGTNEIKQLFNGAKIFSNPKPINLISDFLRIISFNQRNDIILDFFSDSATTAHAVMQLNAEDGGNRKFIMIQLPEECPEKSEAFKAGYKNICEIGKERIRRAGDKIVEENKDKDGIEDLDIGFKVIKIK